MCLQWRLLMTVQINSKPFEKMKAGVDKLADTVRSTLGPNGKNVLIDVGSVYPLSTRDGVTVAHYIKLEDKLEDFGASLVKQAARNTNEEAGDGTSTSTVLAQAIFTEGLKYISAGHSPIKVKRSIDDTVKKCIANLKDISRDVTDNIANVAKISANNDEKLGNIISEAIERVGKDGSVLVEGSTKNENYVSFQEGLIVERGWGETSPLFITNKEKLTIEYDNPEIIIIDENIHDFKQIEKVMMHVAKNKRPLIFIMRDIEDTVLGFILANKLKGGLPVAVIKTPGFNNIELIDDLSCRSGTRHYNSDWNPISNFEPEHLGSAKKVIIGKSDTTIIQGCGDISDRLAELNEQVKAAEDEITKARTQDRINRLTSSVATIHLKANSETEMKDLKLRVEDAVNATRHALSEGIVQGGGTALLRIRPTGDSIGDQILYKALEMPFRYIVSNAGDNADKILAEVEEGIGSFGYNAANKSKGCMFAMGIIDPVKVTRTALEKAVSVSSMLLMTGSCVTNEQT